MIRRYGIYFAWLIALIATIGSLYFSEVLGYIPCTLCWYQRIFMYPLVILLGIASYYNQQLILPYVLPLSVIGGGISLWHVLHQKVPFLRNVGECTVGIPCNEDYINWFGFITIPFLALIAFVLITVLLIFSRSNAEK